MNQLSRAIAGQDLANEFQFQDVADVFRVGKTHVTLDTIVCGFRNGATAEEIAEQHPAFHGDRSMLSSPMTWHMPPRWMPNLQAGERQSADVGPAKERLFDPKGIRAPLLARYAGRESA